MKKNLVTLLVPAYNSADYIFRLLDSILYQTYPEIETIIINDGSTDSTVEIIKTYIERFKSRNYNVVLINQDNVGQAESINKGLKLVEGEFLSWPDSDDWYASPCSIERLVNALKDGGPEVGVSRCAYQRIDEKTGRCVEVSHPSYSDKPAYIFDDAVMDKPGFWLEPGGWMVKTEYLEKFIPGREIYTSKWTGQNSQLLWPYLFYSKCIAIDEPLYCYLLRKNSHSHGLLKDYRKKIIQQIEYGKTFDAVIEGISDINDIDKKKYHCFISERINSQKLYLAIQYNEGTDIRSFIKYKFASHMYFPLRKGDYLNYLLSFDPYLLSIKKKLKNFLLPIYLFVRENKILIALFTFLLVFFMLVSFILISPKVVRKWHDFTFKPVECRNADELELRLLSGTKRLLSEEISSDETVMYYKTVGEFFRRSLNREEVSVYNYGEYGYLLYYTFLYAKEKKDTILLKYVKDKFDHGMLGKSSVPVIRNDQIAYGCIAMELAKTFANNTKYIKFCSNLMNRLDSMEKADGVVLYHEGDLHQHTDGIGLVCPFLTQYGITYNDKHAIQMARNMCEDYVTYGVDYSNGLPAQAYHTVTKIKDYRSNWGRGTSWFLLGIMGLDSLSSQSLSIMEKTDSTLVSLGPLYSQYLGTVDASSPDMSSTIPILYYLHKKRLININREKFAKLISPYVDEYGIIRFNSPSISRPDESPNSYQSHFLSQGIALYFMSIL